MITSTTVQVTLESRIGYHRLCNSFFIYAQGITARVHLAALDFPGAGHLAQAPLPANAGATSPGNVYLGTEANMERV